MNYPTVKQLKYFIALVEHNHFGKAAESCFVSQSAFSVAIKEMENTLGGQLVDRTNKSVTVSNLGREVYQQALVIVSELTRMVDIAQGNLMPLTGKLSLGVIPTIAPFVLPDLLPAIRQKYPQLELNIQEGMTLEIYEKLMLGELDVLLLALPYDLRGVESEILFRDHFKLIAHKKSQHSTDNDYRIDHLKDGSILLLEDGHCLRDHALSACHIRNIDKVSKFATSSMLTLIEMVNYDVGISYVPEMALKSPILKETEIVVRDLASSSYREIGLVWRKGSVRTQEFQLLGKEIKPTV
ncbi:LysR substrate-binding domain-containing protein [Marinicella sp. W31]|uniref:hydrogen peroxide-inducible genes activator n=1 Tax=Marinicella sp. W31 TaxID=3023713 RepID=UPI003756717F